MTDYLTLDEIDALITARMGFTYRDRGLMASALGAPMPVFGVETYEGLDAKAAALLIAANRNHPLLDGNKRTSWVITAAFYQMNGLDLVAPQDDIVEFVLRVANDDADLEFLMVADWLAQHTQDLVA
jgi:death on curing protein